VYLRSPIWYIIGQRRQPQWHTPQPNKDKDRFGYAATQKRQGYLEAHWMYGSLKLFHLMTRQKGPAFLQATQGFGEVHLVGRG
jgi:hypothetical protein